ncbi:hypothetical protein MycrhDRAFT_5501 [Mycolicibacterium rhodesiae JS60]|nr:hypothetical protein MycrhDRAFT_5501 [Mycolicibacterium rhodesiae JS60]
MNTTAAGTARYAGSGVGFVHDGDDAAVWFGDADLYHLDPRCAVTPWSSSRPFPTPRT